MTEPSGILIINKHGGATSHDIVNRVRRLFNTKRVGHTGTLDPLATGVLVVLVGRAAKAAEYLSSDQKGYRATMRLGLTTDTEDITGQTLTVSDKLPTAEAVAEACKKFVGDIEQIPPMYSALKVGGQKLCDLARRGVEVERRSRKIRIDRLDVTPTDSASDYILDVTCSAGTYISTLCADIGKVLGCGAAMATLKRTKAGGFSIEDSITVSELEELSFDERISKLLPTESLFSDIPALSLPPFYEKLCRNGCEIYQKKISSHFDVGERVRLTDHENSFFAIGEVREYENGSAIKAIKFFEL